MSSNDSGFRGRRHTQLDVGTDALEHLSRFVGRAGPEHLFFVDDYDYRQPGLTGAPHNLIEPDAVLAVADDDVFLAVDALPVDKEYLAGAYALRRVDVAERTGSQTVGVAEYIL